MSLNTAHANNGVLIHAGEGILIFSDHVTIEFTGHDNPSMKGTKQGRVYLTTHRVIYNSKQENDSVRSFSMPFVSMREVEVEQPVFGANYIKGKVQAQQNGNWTGEAKFKIVFKHGGAIDFGQAMLRAASMAQRNAGTAPPPPYTPPGGAWYAAPPPAYTPNAYGYGWVPGASVFPEQPQPNSIYMHDSPPPYPGIIPQQGPGAYPQQPGVAGYPQQPGAAGYPQQQPGYQYPPQQQQQFAGGFMPQPTASGYPMQAGFATGPGAGYPNGNVGYPQPGSSSGTMGFSAPPQPPPNSKEAEAAQSAYYDPNRPQTAYVPPPAYYEPPPSYSSLNKKEQ
ncbi:WW domain-binding protein 2 isoform X1 [Anopheles ziemanni]|uniref:WW domain-binding protein 2 isoform X1 n=1 Tax=Anopheles coustani TaxID=139045 RepID=UPI00265A01A3|nr:WW domain-binding protein 2 isoform X1 [Anopheles coustani]XP_058171533.1 WW domain-binding protein 2 isoform X1 [Anopheles ziemanni]